MAVITMWDVTVENETLKDCERKLKNSGKIKCISKAWKVYVLVELHQVRSTEKNEIRRQRQ